MKYTNPVRIHRFGNGLTVLVREDHVHPVASLQFWVETGSCHEGARLGSGLSHFLEHMVFKGTERFSGQELAEKVQALGGLWNAYTSSNRTVYYIEGPSGSWQSFLDVLTQLVFHPVFPLEEVDKEKEVIRREMAMYDDDPDAVAWKLLMETLYLKHPRRYPVLGEPDSFDLLGREDMLDYHAERYCVNNVFVVIAGDVDADKVIAELGTLTRDLAPRPLHGPVLPSEGRQWGRRVARKEFSVPFSKLSLAWRIPEQEHPDSPALAILAPIFGSGRSARLYRKFHDEMGLVHSITASVSQSASEEGIFLISADVDHDKRDAVRDLILQELAKLAQANLSEDLKRNVKRTFAARIKNMATVSGMADETATQWFHFRNTAYFNEWMEAVERIAPDDLNKVIDTWLQPDRLTEVSLDPPSRQKQDQPEAMAHERCEATCMVLPNGIRVVLRPDHRLPLVYGSMAFLAGSLSETAATAGVTSLLAECMLKGTQTRNAEQIAEILENLGGGIDSSSGNNSMTIDFNVMSDDLEQGLELMSDVVLHPTLPVDAVEHERIAMISDVEEQLEDPLSVAFNNLKAHAYGDSTYGLPACGTIQSLNQLSQESVKAHYRRIVTGGNAVISLAGAFDPDAAIALIKRFFADMPSGGEFRCETATSDFRSGDVTAVLDKEQAVLVLGIPGVTVTSDLRARAGLLHAWCSDMAGPIFTGIREESGLAYFASSSLFMGLDAGSILFYLGTSMQQLDEAAAKLDEILDTISRNGMTSAELKRTRASALSAQLLGRQSNKAIAQRLALHVLYDLPVEEFERQEMMIGQITLDEMNAFISEYLSPDRPRVRSIVKNRQAQPLQS